MKRAALIAVSIIAVIVSPQLVAAQSRPDAEKAVRLLAYQTTKAFLTADVNGFKQNVSERSTALLGLAFQSFQQDAKYKEELQRAGVTSFDQFLEYIMVALSGRLAGPIAPDKAAEKISAESQISFVSNSEAKILFNNSDFARAKLAAGRWKIDLSATIKRILLEEITNPEMKAKIKNF